MDGLGTRHGGLFFSPLETQQTKLHRPPSSAWRLVHRGIDAESDAPPRKPFPHVFGPAHEIETNFRHRGWKLLRSCVRDALVKTGRSRRVIERFDRCGSECHVEVSDDGQRFRLRANYCGSRWCHPCQAARARDVAAKLLSLMTGKETWFTTLTLRRDDKPLEERRDRLLQSFAKLRRQKIWLKNCAAGAYCVQITRGEHGDHWHVHLHCIHTGNGLHKSGLSDAWLDTTGDSWVVDSEKVSNPERQARYVARYASKGCEEDVLLDPIALREAVATLGGSRMLGTFGKWRGVEFESDCEEQSEWRRLGRLRDIAKAAVEKEAWAVGIMTALNVRACASGSSVRFETITRTQSERRKKMPALPAG